MSGSARTFGRSGGHEHEEGPAPAALTRGADAVRPLLEDVDGLLDEIDAVLEVNAEEFVRGYVQKGGQ